MLDTTPLDLSCFFDILFHEKHASDSTKKYLLLDVASNFSSVSLIMATRKFIILLSIFFANFQCLHSRISDRWAALKDLNARCSVIAPVTFDLPYEPGKVTPPFEVADLTIVSKKKGLTFEERHEITSFLNLDIVVYVYVFNTCIFIIPVMYTFFFFF